MRDLVIADKSEIVNIADAVRSLTGGTTTMNLSGMKSHLNTTKTSIDNAFAAIADKGVTVPDGSTSDAMASLIASIEAGGTGVDVVGAASYMPETYDSVKSKDILPVPGEFMYDYAYTNKSESITMSIAAEAGDTIIAVYAMRKLTGTPDAPEGWELIRHCDPHENDATLQSLTVYKYCADNAGTVSVTMVQPDPTQRFYGYLVNLRDSLIGSNEVAYSSLEGGKSINPIHFNYEHTLVLTTNAVCNDSTTNRDLGLCWDGALSTFHPKVAFMDESSKVSMYSSRLSRMYLPWGNKQNGENYYLSVRSYNGNRINIGIFTVHLLLEIIPGACSRWVTASDNTLTLATLEADVELSATEAMSIILGGDN